MYYYHYLTLIGKVSRKVSQLHIREYYHSSLLLLCIYSIINVWVIFCIALEQYIYIYLQYRRGLSVIPSDSINELTTKSDLSRN